MTGAYDHRFAAVVLDCDGLLLETESRWTIAEERLFARYGRTFGRAEKEALLGKSGSVAARVLERLLDLPGEGSRLWDELLELAHREVPGAQPMPGARELVGALRGRVPLGLASSSPRSLVSAALAGAGLDGAFDESVCGDEVERPKPAPDIYQAVCRRLGAEPGRAVAFEDSPTGAAAARAAGMYVVAVPTIPGSELDADLVLPSLEDPRVRELLALA